MERELLLRMIEGTPPTDKELAEALYEMCDAIHASCDDDCIMLSHGFVVCDGKRAKMIAVDKEDAVGYEYNEFDEGCPFFKDGERMLKAIRRRMAKNNKEKK